MTVTRQPRTGPGEPLFSFQAGSSDLATTLTTNAWRLKHWRAIRMETNTPSLSCIGSMMLTLERRSSKAGSFLGSGLGQQREKRAPSHSWAMELHWEVSSQQRMARLFKVYLSSWSLITEMRTGCPRPP